jgi:hypothetical protein
MPNWILVLNRYSGILAGLFVGGAVGMLYLPALIPMESVQRVTGVVGWRVGYWGVLWLLVAGGAAVGLAVGLACDAIVKPHAKAGPDSPASRIDQRRRAIAKHPAKPSSVDASRAFAAQLPRSVARSFEKQLKAQTVTRQQAEDFVGQPPPRKIPPNIAYRFLRGALGMMTIGAAFVGVCVAVILMSRGQPQEWGGIVFLSLFLSAGVLMILFSGRFWWRQRRLLRGGELAAARIRTVESTGATDENDDEVFWISAHYQAAGQSRVGRGKVRGQVGRYARNLAAEAKAASILYDTADSGRIVLVDSLVYPPDR